MRKVGMSWIALLCVACVLLAACSEGHSQSACRLHDPYAATVAVADDLEAHGSTDQLATRHTHTDRHTHAQTHTHSHTHSHSDTHSHAYPHAHGRADERADQCPSAHPHAHATESPSETDSSANASADEGSDVPTWVWWLLGLLLVALAVAIPLIVRARRRAAWTAELTTASEEVAWFARVLLPQLQSASSVDQLSGGWSVGLARVTAVQDQLTALSATARRDVDQARSTQLRDAVREARERVDGLVAARAPGPVSQEVASIASTAGGSPGRGHSLRLPPRSTTRS